MQLTAAGRMLSFDIVVALSRSLLLAVLYSPLNRRKGRSFSLNYRHSFLRRQRKF